MAVRCNGAAAQSSGNIGFNSQLAAELVARPTEEDAGVAPEQRWLFPGRSDHQPLTTRQFSRLFKEAAKAAGLRKTAIPAATIG